MQNFDKSNIDASQIIWVDKIYGKSNDSPIDLKSWENFYYGVVDDLKPGFNILELHLGFENEELKAMMIDHPDWGAKWRELDLLAIGSRSRFLENLLDLKFLLPASDDLRCV